MSPLLCCFVHLLALRLCGIVHLLFDRARLFHRLGEYVLRTACAQVKSWRESGQPDLWVSVNISSRQFQDQNLIKAIEATLAQTGLPGDGLQIEITERVAMRDLEHSIKFLFGLRRLGVQVSLDDFGNGYSSLSYINRFPLNVLKIDRSFIRDIEINKNSEAIAASIIAWHTTSTWMSSPRGWKKRSSFPS